MPKKVKGKTQVILPFSFPLYQGGETFLKLPKGAEALSVTDKPMTKSDVTSGTLWIRAHGVVKYLPGGKTAFCPLGLEKRKFFIVRGEGMGIPGAGAGRFIGTVTLPDNYTFHVFEAK